MYSFIILSVFVYKDSIISTIVDFSFGLDQFAVYKDSIISTIVDWSALS